MFVEPSSKTLEFNQPRRTYVVVNYDTKFLTKYYSQGRYLGSWLSKRKKFADKKGEYYVAGNRQATKYSW